MTESSFKDHFSGHADDYARYRPDYPPALFAWLAETAPARDRAWDCATGNGQAAVALAEHFGEVVATDASETQVASAFAHPRVTYRVAAAETSGLEDASVSLVTVAQALHWFDIPAFWAEAGRVLRPGGVLAVWAYDRFRCAPEVDAAVDRLYTDVVGPYWPPDRKMIDDGYPVRLPFPRVEAPPFAMAKRWTLDEVAGYLRTWSAVRRYQAANGRDPVSLVLPELRAAWGEGAREVRWPLFRHVGRKADVRSGGGGSFSNER
ncbi:MAG TPA: class I SAM-dependent methyltransferase [Longimicrobium sp.]|nr:class I SAM-dependent methyltransferase [Longimicrobium sp.]